jgi:hypothetical protein
MGITSSTPSITDTNCKAEYYYKIFKTFFDEYIELQPPDHKDAPFVMSFNQLSGAFYSYIANVVTIMKNPQSVNHNMYYLIHRYTTEQNDGVIKVWGFWTGFGESRTYNNIMISGIRLAKVPLT